MNQEKEAKSKSKLTINKEKKSGDNLLKNPSKARDMNWWYQTNKNKDNKKSKEEEFFEEEDSKAETIINPGGKKVHDIPDKLGYFETEHGTVAVGYKKFNKSNELGFSIVSETDKESTGIPENRLESSNTYFGQKYEGDNKRFQASNLSFEYNPQDKFMQKLSYDDDNVTIDDKKELLYESDENQENIQKLKEAKQDAPPARDVLNNKIEKNKKLKEEKEDRNKKFLKEIQDFINKFEKNRIKKISDSDDVIVAKKRIEENSDMMLLIAMIKRLLEKITGMESIDDEMLKRILNIDVKKASIKDLQKIVDKFKSQAV